MPTAIGGVLAADAQTILIRAADHLGAGPALEGTQARVIREGWLQLVVASKPGEPELAYVLSDSLPAAILPRDPRRHPRL
jgi:hypothetical protein